MKKNWQTIIKAIIAVLSALLGALGTSAMYNSWWTSTKEEGSPQRTSLFYCFDFNITNTLWQYRSRRLAISLASIGNIDCVDWQYRLRRLAISLVSIGNIDCVIQQRQVFRRFSAVRDRSQHWAKRQHKSPTMTAIWPLCRSCPLDFPLPIRFGVMLKPHWHRKRQGTASPSPRITCGKTI